MPQSTTIPVDGNDFVLTNIMASSVPLTIQQPISTFAGVDPTWTGVYFQAIVDSPGTVASNNYVAVLNPVGSGKLAIALGFIASNYSGATVTGAKSLTVFRTSSQSGGTLVTAASVNRFFSAFPNPVAEVRIGNPTVVTTNPTNPMLGIPPALGTGAQSPETVAPTPGASFIFLPGEGIVFNVPAGDVDQLWNMQYIWAEKPM